MSESTTYLSVAKAAEYVDATSINAFRKWVRRDRVPHFYMGRNPRFLRRDLDEALGNRKGAKRALKPSASRFQQSSRSLHGAGVSGELISERHAPEVSEALSGSPRNSIEQVTR